MGFEYVAVPWPAHVEDPQPGLRRSLEAAGFTLLGGCALTDAGRRSVGTIAASYGGEHAGTFARRAAEPSQVLASPDGTAFVVLAWLWECRYATFTTVLADGRLLQTSVDWEADPVWPQALAAHYHRTTDRHTEQLVLATDLGTRIVAGGVEEAWEQHRARVAAAPGPVPDHTSLTDLVRICTAESAARSTWVRRVQVASGLLTFLVLLVPYVAASRLLGHQPWWIDAALIGVFAGLFVILNTRVWLRVRRWRRLRPAFRAPVPSGAPDRA